MKESIKVLEPKGILDSAAGNQIRQDIIAQLDIGVETLCRYNICG